MIGAHLDPRTRERGREVGPDELGVVVAFLQAHHAVRSSSTRTR